MFKVLLVKVAKNITSAVFGKNMLFWGLEFFVKKTDNLIDDNVVALVKAADENDAEAMLEYSKKLVEEVTNSFSK